MSIVRRALGTAAIALGFVLVAPAPAVFAEAQDKDCADFSSQADAQAVLDQDRSDPHRLDADHDGVACESKFGEQPGPAPADDAAPADDQVEDEPVGGVDTGGLSDDSGSGDPAALIVLGGALLAGSGVVVVRLRRRAAR